MIYPVNEYLHQNLNTTFTNIFELIAELKNNRFTGYIAINYWQFEALILIDSGQITQSFYKTKSNYEAGLKAYELILEKTQEKDGTINVIRLDSDVVYLLAGIPYSKKNAKEFILTNDSLIKVQDLLSNNGYSALITAEYEELEYTICLFFYEGNLISLSGKKGTNLEMTGIKDLEKVLKILKTHSFKASIRHIDLQDTVEVLNDFSLQATVKEWAGYYNKMFGDLYRLLTADKKKFKNVPKMILEIRSKLADDYHFLDPFMDVISIKEGEITLNAYINFYDFVNGMDHLISLMIDDVLEQKWKKVKDIDLKKITHEAGELFEGLLNMIDNGKRELSEKYV